MQRGKLLCVSAAIEHILWSYYRGYTDKKQILDFNFVLTPTYHWKLLGATACPPIRPKGWKK